MHFRPWIAVIGGVAAAGLILSGSPLGAVESRIDQAADVPADLRPLLTPRPSELRLVAQRYALDRQTLDANYAGSFDRLGVAHARGSTAIGRSSSRVHDELIRQNSMPIALLRLAVNGQPLTPETPLDWRFYGDLK